MVSATASLLNNVAFVDALGLFSPTLPKLSDVDARVIGTTPVPVNVAVCGLFDALSVTVSVAVRLPSTEGVNVTFMLQFCPGPSVFGLRGQFPLQT